MLLSNLDDEGTQMVDLAMNSTSSFKFPSSFTSTSFAQALLANEPEHLYKPLYI